MDLLPVGGRPQDCVWSAWSPWSSCSITCGPGPGLQRRNRTVQVQPASGGAPCSSSDGYETILCSIDEPCPEVGLATTTGCKWFFPTGIIDTYIRFPEFSWCNLCIKREKHTKMATNNYITALKYTKMPITIPNGQESTTGCECFFPMGISDAQDCQIFLGATYQNVKTHRNGNK
jgi:hypothetical protein